MKKLSLLLCVAMLFLTGCGTSVISLTDEQGSVVAAYAAGVLLKHSDAGEKGLVPVSASAMESADAVEAAEKEETEPEQSDENKTADSQTDAPQKALEQVLDLSGCALAYVGNEIMDSYVEQDYYSMIPASGNVYLVLNFTITNAAESGQTVDLLTSGGKYSVLINQETEVAAENTILPNDLALFSAEIEPTGVQNAVLIFEISQETADSIQQLTLQAKVGEDTGVLELQ